MQKNLKIEILKFIAHDWLGVKMNYTARMKSVKRIWDSTQCLMMNHGIIHRMELCLEQTHGKRASSRTYIKISKVCCGT